MLETKNKLSISKRINLSTLDAGGKIPPQTIDIEEAVLGAIMIEKSCYDRATLLKPEYFYHDTHQYIFEAIQDLAAKSNPIDLNTVQEQLKVNGHLDIVGGPYTLAKLTSKVSSAAHIEYHCALIFQKFGLRELIRICGQTITEAYDDSTDLFELQSTLNTQLDGISVSQDRELVDLFTAYKNRITELADIQEKGITTTGIDTGWPKVNNILHGWQKTDLIIIAARPGQGKSALACNIVINVAKQNIPVAIFSLEMNLSQLIDRIISAESGVGGEFIKKGMTPAEWNIVTNTKFSYPLFIDDSSNSSLNVLKSKIRKAVRTQKIQMAVVDYLQLMQAKEKGESRQQEIGKISRGLKLLAKELKIPIIALAQLSREAEGTEPQLNHLREAGDIEQDADLVIFPYNKQAHDLSIINPVIELRIAKHRHGEPGIRMMQFKKATQKFIEYNEGFN